MDSHFFRKVVNPCKFLAHTLWAGKLQGFTHFLEILRIFAFFVSFYRYGNLQGFTPFQNLEKKYHCWKFGYKMTL